jgi:DNA-binding NtrC family response regulator
MRDVVDTVERIRDSDCGVFITGERGVGKGILARMIHATSRRRNLPFLSVNCVTFPEELFESELFGSNRLSACPSDRYGQGMPEPPDSGTLYLDGITEMPLLLQKRLLKLIEDSEIPSEPEEKPVRTNVRLIASSEGDPRALIAEHRFLEDLFYKLNVIEIFIPPLGDRKEDIEPLCNFFLNKFQDRMQKKVAGFSKEALDLLNNYSFPGNIEELENIVERAVLVESGSFVSPQSLPQGMKMYRAETFEPGSIKTINQLTREYADRVYRMVERDKIRAAELLGISENELSRLLEER